jgi:hypothetical protein
MNYTEVLIFFFQFDKKESKKLKNEKKNLIYKKKKYK